MGRNRLSQSCISSDLGVSTAITKPEFPVDTHEANTVSGISLYSQARGNGQSAKEGWFFSRLGALKAGRGYSLLQKKTKAGLAHTLAFGRENSLRSFLVPLQAIVAKFLLYGSRTGHPGSKLFFAKRAKFF